jgi:hypothetical protein
MPLDIVNLTSQSITFQVKKKAGREERVVVSAYGQSGSQEAQAMASHLILGTGIMKGYIGKNAPSKSTALLCTTSHTFSLRRPLVPGFRCCLYPTRARGEYTSARCVNA